MSFGSLARRITAVVNKTLVTGMILVAGLAVGRQLVEWWRPAPEFGTRTDAEDGFGDPQRAHEIEFLASGWRLQRQAVAGDQQAARRELTRSCRKVLAESGRGQLGQKVTPRLAAVLAKVKPVEEQPGRWRLYELDQGLPLVLGIAPGGDRQASERAPAAEVSVAPAAGDVVTWGIAIPAGPEGWAAYTLTPGGWRRDGGLGRVPPPPGAEPLLAVEAAEGGAITTFRGRLEEQGWKAFYDEWFRREGWTATTPWRKDGAAWRAEFRKQADDRQLHGHLEFLHDGQRGDSGTVLITATQTAGNRS